MGKLFFSLVAPVFTGSCFRLFVLLQHRVGVVLVSAVAIMSSAGSLTLKAARVYWCQLGQSAASPAPGSGVPFCLVHKSCTMLFGWSQATDSMQWHSCSWLVVEAHSLVPVSPSDFTVLCGSAAAPRESKCPLSCHFQAVLVHRESFA